MNKSPLPSSQCVVWFWPWSSFCWICSNFQSRWILSRVFLRALILFLQPYHVAHHRVVPWLLMVLAVAPWPLLLPWPLLVIAIALLHLLLFLQCILSCLYPIFSIILLYNKEVVSRAPCSLSASASRVAVKGADTPLYNFEIVFLKNMFIVLLIHFWEIFW